MAEDCILDHQPWHDGNELYQPYERLFRDVWCIGPTEYKRLWTMCDTPEQFAVEVNKSAEKFRQIGGSV